MQTDPTATWSVRIKFGTPRLRINGRFDQEFEIMAGTSPDLMTELLRRAMRRLAPEREAKPVRKVKK
jgi:hypothetical protein